MLGLGARLLDRAKDLSVHTITYEIGLRLTEVPLQGIWTAFDTDLLLDGKCIYSHYVRLSLNMSMR